MRNLQFIIILLVSIKCYSQTHLPIDSTTGKINYTEVVKVDSISKTELFSRAKMWFAKAFVSSQDVVQNADEANTVIFGKANFTGYTKALGMIFEQGIISFNLNIACKDGRYKYCFTDFVHHATAGNKLPSGGELEKDSAPFEWMGGQWRYLKSDLDQNIQSLITSLKAAMNKPLISSDW